VLDTSKAPGISVAIAKGGHLVFATRFRIASVTKPVTSTGIAQAR
jgi:CubicO group peptidase (beta-lactamase class C family)